MGRYEFYPAILGPRFFTSSTWAVFLAVSAVAGLTALLLGSLKTGVADAVLGALLALSSLEGLYRWYNACQPVVIVEDEALVWRSGLRMRRHSLADLALSPDPFDVTVLRLQTRSGKLLRLPRDGVAKAAELERLLLARLQPGAGDTRGTAPSDTDSHAPVATSRQGQ